MKNLFRKYWLHFACVIIWVAVTLMIVIAYQNWKTLKTVRIETPKEIIMIENVEKVEVNNYYAPVTINNIEVPQIKELATGDVIKTIYEATRTWDWKDTFQYSDAMNLCYLIDEIAKQEGLKRNQGYLIVHIESDYRANAVSGCGAVGLTQVMPNCLAEYNDNHIIKYTMQDMLDPRKNLTVGFWYYNRILNHYDKYYGYITHTDYKTEIRDAYIAYNYGVTRFSNIGRWGRNELRQGRYPENIYGSHIGDAYTPISRLNDISQYYF